MVEPLAPVEEQSIGQLLRRIVTGLNELVDRQIELVKREARENVVDVLKASKTLAIGAGLGLLAALLLLNLLAMTIVLGFNEIGARWVPIIGPWLGWILLIIIIAVLGFVTYRLIVRGIEEVQISPVGRTRQTLGEDIEWAQRLLTRNGR
ncbi:MAG: phage holin family protein [Chloroflexota bacterium]